METQKTESFIAACKSLRMLSPQIRISQIEMLCQVGINEPMSLSDLGHKCDISISGISRAMDVLGTKGRKDGKGTALGWIEIEDKVDDDRTKQLWLSRKGRVVMETLLGSME